MNIKRDFHLIDMLSLGPLPADSVIQGLSNDHINVDELYVQKI